MLCTESPRIAISPQAWGCTVHAHAIAPCFEKSPPQAWGCTAGIIEANIRNQNLPTSVGMYRPYRHGASFPLQSPHKRGDVPHSKNSADNARIISPQAWGCTGWMGDLCLYVSNLPTSVGMYRPLNCAICSRAKSPHKRGDVPRHRRSPKPRSPISPQAWGCTASRRRLSWLRPNLPTSVGMYRPRRALTPMIGESPHKRGDVTVQCKHRECR